ncbi:hypothetical protein [Roseibium aggregatum]|jgi:hypothetical protein|uniref:Uncharacterized protein n=1 Tax=Roseibium aggregatum TaxID=187304 RepID=A0A0M6YEA1_9HYPH|nr:hypothetical protein [Roseibium aggregatum]CTQ47341.1 hypothetical protein LAL4801_05803 [Roseibium aggregatum]
MTDFARNAVRGNVAETVGLIDVETFCAKHHPKVHCVRPNISGGWSNLIAEMIGKVSARMQQDDVPAEALLVIGDIKELVPGGGLAIVVQEIQNMDPKAQSAVMRDVFDIVESTCDRAETVCSCCGSEGNEYDDGDRAYIFCDEHAQEILGLAPAPGR